TSGYEQVDQRGRTAALDLLLRDKVAHAGPATPLEVDEAALRKRHFSLDHHFGELDGKEIQLEEVSQQVPRLDRGEPGDGRVPDCVNLDGVAAGGQGREGEPP